MLTLRESMAPGNKAKRRAAVVRVAGTSSLRSLSPAYEKGRTYLRTGIGKQAGNKRNAVPTGCSGGFSSR
ncbi:MAG: hypothetical protein Fues2KO_19890 [Fuerstiella sp.]